MAKQVQQKPAVSIPYLGFGLLSGGVVFVAEDAMSITVAYELPMLVHVRMGVLTISQVLTGTIGCNSYGASQSERRARILSRDNIANKTTTIYYSSYSGVGGVVGGRCG